MIVEIDTREPDNVKKEIHDIVDILYTGSDINVEIVEKSLPAGDWKIIDNDGRELGTLLTERKGIDIPNGINDMIASRNDGRWEEQREKLSDSDKPVLYGVTGFLTGMRKSDIRSIGTYLASMWRLGIMATWMPTDFDLVHLSFKLFEMKPGILPAKRKKDGYDKNIHLCARVFYQQRGMSRRSAIAISEIVKIPSVINDLSPWDLSHVFRKARKKVDQKSLLKIAAEFYCEWHGIDFQRFVVNTKALFKQNRGTCRTCGSAGKLFDRHGEYIPCPTCGEK